MITADISIFTLQRLYTFITIMFSLDARVCKALKHFLWCVARDSLRGLYKDSLTYDNSLRFQVKVVITLPNEEVP